MSGINATEMLVFLLLFVFVAVMGFMAARWKSGDTMDHLDEWGLGGRKFGGWITWFLVGGDLYTAYTFVAVPALMYASGAIGFFALPYTVVLYPIVFLPVLRLWSVSRSDGYVTPADFVRGRYSSPTLALIVAITGIVATMPYIALQLIGGVIILQTLPAVAIALYTRWLHSKALIAGWVVGMAWALYLLWTIPEPRDRQGAFRWLGADPVAAVDHRLASLRRLDGADLCRRRRPGGQPAGRGAGHDRPAAGRGRRRPGCHPGCRLPRRRGRPGAPAHRRALSRSDPNPTMD